MRNSFLIAPFLITLSASGLAQAAERSITGVALIRERIALPPNARFEAVVEDTARARITIDGKLAFTTDTVAPAPVAQGGAVELVMRRVGSNALAPPASRRTGAIIYVE
jgi:uncharacterized lipoprotein YbaY